MPPAPTRSWRHRLAPTRRRTWPKAAIAAAAAAAAILVVAAAAGTASAQTATTDTSPVNLSNNINMANGTAATQATVIEGDARFEVLAPEVIRMEYSPTGSFLNDPTFDIQDRNFTVPAYTSSVSGGWLTITTSQMTLKYQVGSGPFTAVNTQLQLLGALPPGASANVTPTWEWECTFGQACQSGAAALTGGATIANDHNNYQSPPGFIAGLSATGADATWQLIGAPTGNANVTIRYSNYVGALGGPAPRTESLVVNGTTTQVTLPATASWDTWSTVTVPVTLTAGTNNVALDCESTNSCNVNIDDIAVTAPNATAAPFLPANPLGGYIRSYDSANGSYSASPACASGQSGATCTANIPQLAAGLLDQSGWYLLDDSQTAVWTSTGWIGNRPAGDVQDGYLFGYGDDYHRRPRGPGKADRPRPAARRRTTFGNWFSQYYPLLDRELPRARSSRSSRPTAYSLDNLSVDTDWKSPSTWDGWEWNSSPVPRPHRVQDWAASEDIHVALNVHASHRQQRPALHPGPGRRRQHPQRQRHPGGVGLGQRGAGRVLLRHRRPDPERSRRDLARLVLRRQPGVHPRRHPRRLDQLPDRPADGQPGRARLRPLPHRRVLPELARPAPTRPAPGPTTAARSRSPATPRAPGTPWPSQAQLSQDEGSIGEPYVSDDIGSFLGNSTGNGNDPDDLYLRWLQLGTFQPIMREHSNSGQNPRLPWEYDAATQAVGDQFLQLREELVPYLYTLADQSYSTGLPMTQALYLDYPAQAAAYTNPERVPPRPGRPGRPRSPSPGQARRPPSGSRPAPGRTTSPGPPSPAPPPPTINVPTSRMPVFVKAGGIIPLQPASGNAQTAGTAPITLQVHAGANGTFAMYDDAGTGLGYQSGQSAQTPITLHRERLRGNVNGDDRPRDRLLPRRAQQPQLHDRPGRRVPADLRPAQRPDPRLLRLELQQRQPTRCKSRSAR